MKRIAPVLACAVLSLSAAWAQSTAFRIKAGRPTLMTAKALAATDKRASGATIGADRKSVMVKGKSARLVVRTGPKSDMMSYRIMGLRNPTITVPSGAKLTILFVNVDDDMLHDLRITASQPPFASKIGKTVSSGSSALPPMKGENFSGQELTIMAPSNSGAYSYLCTTPGHAAAGMFGKLIVK